MDIEALYVPLCFAWYRLVRHRASLRFDDSQHMSPADMRYDELSGLTLVIHQSKTTGPGKKVATMYGYVHPEAYLRFKSWLKTCLDLWAETDHDRKYFLPRPCPSLPGLREEGGLTH
jgi:hypothetical protein